MEEDESIYNAIIIALVIGIIVVIITLLIARPKPETFTELYFENHKLLPKYVELYKNYNYSFTISNHENSSSNYNYTIKEELYGLNYDCDMPDIYFEEKNSTRIAESKEPLLIVGEDDYSVSYDYRIRNGNKIALKLKSLDEKEKYSFVIDEAKQEASFIKDEVIASTKLNILPVQAHKVRVNADKERMKFYFDGKNIFDIVSNIKTPKEQEQKRIPVVAYSKINETVFEEEMNYLYKNGFKTITFADWKKGNIPEKPVILVFESYSKAMEIMDKYHFVGVISIIPKKIYMHSRGYMTERQLYLLINKGWEIAATGSLLKLNERQRELQFKINRDEMQTYFDYVPETFILNEKNYTEECGKFYETCVIGTYYPEYLNENEAFRIMGITTLERFRKYVDPEYSEVPKYRLKSIDWNWNNKGYFSFEGDFADINNVAIKKNGIEQKRFNIKHGDVKYEKVQMKETYSFKTDLPGYEFPPIVARYEAEKPLNLTDYSFELSFRMTQGDELKINTDELDVSYNEAKKELSAENMSFKVPIKNRWLTHRVEIFVKNGKAAIYFDNNLVGEIENIMPTEDPAIEMPNSYAEINYLNIRSNQEPLVIEYKTPRGKEQAELPKIEVNETEKYSQAITWENYSISAYYRKTQENSSFKLSLSDNLNELYSVSIQDNLLEIAYLKENNMQKYVNSLPNTPAHRIDIDVIKNKLSFMIDNMAYEQEIDKAGNGTLFIGYNGISLEALQAENAQTRETILQTSECKPILLKEYFTHKTASIEREEKQTFNSSVRFNERFDIAKIGISLDSGQEIHFWVTRI